MDGTRRSPLDCADNIPGYGVHRHCDGVCVHELVHGRCLWPALRRVGRWCRHAVEVWFVSCLSPLCPEVLPGTRGGMGDFNPSVLHLDHGADALDVLAAWGVIESKDKV